jgi:hypothetical protein
MTNWFYCVLTEPLCTVEPFEHSVAQMNFPEKKKNCDTPTDTQMCSIYKIIPKYDPFEEMFCEVLIKSV